MSKKLIIFFGFIATVLALVFVALGFRAEFFDIFGIIVFIFLAAVGYWMLKKNKNPDWIGASLLTIGVLGLIVDCTLVLRAFLIN